MSLSDIDRSRKLAAAEKSLDDDCTSLKAEILELCIDLGKLVTKAYNADYQQTADMRLKYLAQLGSILDALQYLSDSAGDLVTATEAE